MHSTHAAASADQIVLVVDKDPAVRASLQFALEIEDFVVLSFESGEALLAHDTLPLKACLITDFSLPKMNGFELATALRDRGFDFPTILMTTDPPKHLRRETIAAGLTLIEKPLLGHNLAEAIREAFTES
jgi:two-component system, LuxR family, response regulator FixJ